MYNMCTHSLSYYDIDKYKTLLFLKPTWAGFVKGKVHLTDYLAAVSEIQQ